MKVLSTLASQNRIRASGWLKPGTHYPYIWAVNDTRIYGTFCTSLYGPYIRVTGAHYPYIREPVNSSQGQLITP